MLYKYKTLSELIKNCPIGSKLNYHRTVKKSTCYWANKIDKEMLRKLYDDIVFDDDGTCSFTETRERFDLVAAHLFDGEYWYPVVDTFDGFVPIEVEDINESHSK